ncbi:OsmC family peroxiredoxin [Rudaeicoccus suwonensis]|uniref:Osmotically inducible protein OsmC n=1 Tax=Rudaeicoccus suwonensis TaxID=657409 RepID=A0A561E862_9MICO|nr:OsmC family peroxiredoxin [Rudaeicoccus suwonensis]TWE11805.1 osmotically inducible protein OsmC [Rudaeicoccus suwonensis]
MKAHGSASWHGSWREGGGQLSTASGSMHAVGYTYASRFESTDGVSPEELLAASYAGCLNQAFANAFGWGNFIAERIDTTVEVETLLGMPDGPPGRIHITMRASVDGITESQFTGLTNAAKNGCLIGRMLGVTSTMDAQLITSAPAGACTAGEA